MPTTTPNIILPLPMPMFVLHRDSVIVTVHPIPMQDRTRHLQNCYSIAQIIMSATGTGTWSLGSGSAGTADIGSPTNQIQMYTISVIWVTTTYGMDQ